MRGGEKKPFEAVRAEIEAEVRQSLAQRRWAEAAEQFTNTVYEQSDSLQPVVDKLKLEKNAPPPCSARRRPVPRARWPRAKLLQKPCSRTDVPAQQAQHRRRGRRREPARLGAHRRATRRRDTRRWPKCGRPCARVCSTSRAAALARKEGEARLAALRQAPAESLPIALTSRAAQTQGLPRRCSTPCCAPTPASCRPWPGVDLGAQGYVVLRVTQVLPREATPGGDEPLRLQYAQAWAAAEADAYLGALRKRFKVDIKAAASAAAEAASAPAR